MTKMCPKISSSVIELKKKNEYVSPQQKRSHSQQQQKNIKIYTVPWTEVYKDEKSLIQQNVNE